METEGVTKQYVGMDSSMLMEMAHSKHTTQNQKVAAVSDQFEAVLVKQYLKEALKPMFKGVFNEDGGAHRMYRHFFTDAISESIAPSIVLLSLNFVAFNILSADASFLNINFLSGSVKKLCTTAP